ncbi:unnamed protein product [Thlaspi arvense]|uniref:DUF8040 domain-containing protein n=1 Tax=Thlaspi arvense TaxID=13288 RepID=A0AAU9SEM2_THLAR|nr:unnamed protein product [Thlaspi arvense]
MSKFFIMDRIVYEYEEAKAKQKRRRTADFEIDVHIMVLMLTLTARINNCSAQIERPIRRAPTQLGYEYLQKAMKEDSQHFCALYRMSPRAFLKLCDIILERTNIVDTRNTSVEEMLATFLLTVSQNSRYTQTRDIFNISAFAAKTCSQENVASSSNAQEQSQEDDESYSDAEELVGTQEQQKEFANNWQATIAANMWGDANDDGYQP